MIILNRSIAMFSKNSVILDTKVRTIFLIPTALLIQVPTESCCQEGTDKTSKGNHFFQKNYVIILPLF